MGWGRVALFPAATFVVPTDLPPVTCGNFAIGREHTLVAPQIGFRVVSNLFIQNPLRA